jgi:hypothetical protein
MKRRKRMRGDKYEDPAMVQQRIQRGRHVPSVTIRVFTGQEGEVARRILFLARLGGALAVPGLRGGLFKKHLLLGLLSVEVLRSTEQQHMWLWRCRLLQVRRASVERAIGRTVNLVVNPAQALGDAYPSPLILREQTEHA